MMDNWSCIRRIDEIYKAGKISLPVEKGVYAFWWLGPKEELMNQKRKFKLSGRNKKDDQQEVIEVELEDWWPTDSDLPPCLYVGRSTNIKKRFSQHLLNGTSGRRHKNIPEDGTKRKAHTTTCQLRYGIEHIFRDEPNPLEIIYTKVGFSYKTEFRGNPTVERFFEENLRIGTWRPWFNIDCER